MGRLWDTGSGRLVRTIAASVGRNGDATAAVFSADGATLAIGTQLGGVTLFDPDTGKSVGVLPRTSDVNDLRFAPEGGRLVVAGATFDVKVWDLHRKAFTLTLRGHSTGAAGGHEQ